MASQNQSDGKNPAQHGSSTGSSAGTRAGKRAPDWAGGLKQLYDSVVEEPLPDAFRDLLDRLDQAGAAPGRDKAAGPDGDAG